MKIKTYFRYKEVRIRHVNTEISEGVKVTVTAQYRPDLSQVESGRFFFNYRIIIENSNPFAIQLLHRDWYIFDSLKEANFVSGEGVIGEQPQLMPNESFTYISGVEIASEIGYMKGFYTFKNTSSETHFQVHVPCFHLITPFKAN